MKKPTLDDDLKLLGAVSKDVWKELGRQRQLYGVQRYYQGEWLPIVVEEVGEVAQAMQQDTQAAKDTDADSLYDEIVQSAAVLMSWAAQLKGEGKDGQRLP